MDIEQLMDDVRPGRITPDRLVELVLTLQRELQAANQELDQATWRIEELERKRGASPTPKVSEPFSMRAEEQRQEARGKKRKRKRRSRGRRTTTAEKVARAVRTEKYAC